MDAAVSVSSEVYFPGSRMMQIQNIVEWLSSAVFLHDPEELYVISLREMELNGKQKQLMDDIGSGNSQ